jgi:uncharacterized membrane protein
MSIQKELPRLVEAGVIPQETANRIEAYYAQQKQPAGSRLLTVFSVLGAILMGRGIILVIAHNWDELAVPAKTIIAFFPLIAGQVLCFYSLVKRRDNKAWTESTSASLFLSVGAVISVIAQVYHIPGKLDSFLFTWMWLCLPIVYIMNSSVAAVMFLIGITWYGTLTGYNDSGAPDHWYWAFLLLLLPHYYRICRENAAGSLLFIMNWLIPVSVTTMLASFAEHAYELLMVAYINLFAVFYLVGSHPFFIEKKALYNSYRIMGALGTVIILLALSFDSFWRTLIKSNFRITEHLVSPEFIVAVTLLLAALTLVINKRRQGMVTIKPTEPVFILFFIIFLTGCYSPVAAVFINLMMLVLGIQTIRMGAKDNHLGIFNYGLLIVLALATCRFFDERISFVLRGLMFIITGIGFFAANYFMLKRRKENE